mmetsp:Transcript_98651/g.175675  ORF Transcript_98651/g.175675 Transcript_98651/m.175675 type:complete len:225 (-) Transcript_98651:90-764(-)|eukprot:CAMPEP_0197639974 /NCGR_PEP_ID=MMETSP1338-20131121/14426_1 /TAXON_ID=43686 ORGANISM="Pelagodinium beii, Strain RCC1491" /NCGR_SAMPLE_ID=MMETSP1338 /ASSEMBLY_ACC=CAM_ASM_000754 /LENGTH=224 /DNA_ID=CAMNT_0043212775 /DNA_START=57 /DNA_END=731 /DNA_ORIENTATION=-
MEEVAALPAPAPIRSAQLLLHQQKAASAELERRLWVTQALLAAARNRQAEASEEHTGLEAQFQAEKLRVEALTHSEQRAAGEAASIAAERRQLRGELAEARQAVFVSGEAGESERLRAELAAASTAANQLGDELQQVLALRANLESNLHGFRERAAEETAEVVRLRKRIEEKGCGLSWLRNLARMHVEDLQGRVNSLDVNLQSVAFQASAPTGDFGAISQHNLP